MSRSTLRTTLVGAAATALIAASVQALPAVASSSTTTHTLFSSAAAVHQSDANADGKDLFGSIFFLQGDATNTLISEGILSPGPKAAGITRSPDMLDVVDTIINGIDAESPTFFADLSADLRSGDPYAVEQALVAAAAQIDKHIETIDVDGSGGGTGMCLATMVGVVGFAYVALSIELGVAINKWVVAPNTKILSGDLSQDQVVAKLTTVLARS